jgi:hypothetical protein
LRFIGSLGVLMASAQCEEYRSPRSFGERSLF